MLPSRQAGAFRARPADAGAASTEPLATPSPVLAISRMRRYRGRLRRLQEPAPAGLRERILRELAARTSP